MKKLVSLVIVTHNNWPFIIEAIESALMQTYEPLEIVIVDNASTDETETRVKERYGNRVRYISQDNRLDGGGYNRGIRESNGEFVQLLDGDDLLARDKIAIQVETFSKRGDVDIVYGDAKEFTGDFQNAAWSEWENRQHDDMLAAILDPAHKGAGLVIHSALFRRSALDRIGMWDESLVGADMDYWIRASWAGCTFVYSPGAWCYHRRRPGQMSSDSTAMVNRTITTLEKALTFIDREPYRSMAARRLAALQYGRALTDLRLDRDSARHLLDRSRATDPGRITPVSYAIGRAIIDMPGARRALKSAPLTALRRTVARTIGVLDS